MWLAVDSGNSRIKWALVRGGKIIQTGAARALAPFAFLAAAAKQCADGIVISDVGGDKRRAGIQKALSFCKNVCYIPPPPLRAGGVHNCYRPPQQLGIDRWLALLAAKCNNKNIIIADAGTALTIDALTDGGKFIGGMIVPGARLMHRALQQQTALTLSDNEESPAPSKKAAAGQNTQSAAAAGMTAAMAGAVLAFRRRILPGAAIIITGGDAVRLLPWLPRAVLHRPHLVMEGIIRWREL